MEVERSARSKVFEIYFFQIINVQFIGLIFVEEN